MENRQHIVEDPTKEEVFEVIEKLKNEKSAGDNGVTAENVKYGGEQLKHKIYEFLVKVRRQGVMPKKWQGS